MASIDDVINDAKTYAGGLLQEARQLVNTANMISQGRAYVNVQDLDWEPGEELGATTEFLQATAPGQFGDQFTAPSLAGLEGNQQLVDYYVPSAPAFPDAPADFDASRLADIPRPNWNIPDFTTAAPSVNMNVPLPAAPSIEMPGDPGRASDSLVAPEVTVPTFDDALLVPDIQLPELGELFTESRTAELEQVRATLAEDADQWLEVYCPGYSDSMTAIEERIADIMQGGNALNQEWEQEIYDRAKVRMLDEDREAREALVNDYARRGFAAPPGAVMSGLSRIMQGWNKNLAETNKSIVIERTQMELEQLRFGMQLSSNIRQFFIGAMQSHLQLMQTANGQALEHAREVCNWAARMYDQRVELFRLELQRYQAEAQVYSVRLESAFAVLKQFEVEVEAEKLKIEVDRNAIALYEARIRGEQQKIELYNSQLQGARTRLETEAQKMAVFESQVRAYAARISGKEAEYNAYRAAVQGDMAKVDVYKTQVDAFTSQVRAAGTKVDAERSIAQSVAEYNRTLIDRRDSEIRRYAAEIQGESARFGSSVDAYKAGLAKYTTDVEARLRLVNANLEREKMDLQAAIARVETNLKAQATNVEGYIRSIASQADITSASAKIIGDMASSALTTNNTILTSED
ncbi:MAG: hypothetical protein CME38_01185 [Haliea sp.]|nr:hypothetical protein [Haliea sp.]